MKNSIVVVSCVFPPEPIVSAQTSAQIAKEMVGLEYQVKVLSPFPSHPLGQDYSQYRRRLLRREITPHGYEVIRCFSLFSSFSNMLSRFLENISFGLSVLIVMLSLSRVDIVYGNTWPIFSQGLLLLACKLRRIPLVLSVQDLYPESLLVQKRGIEPTSKIYKFLHWLDAQIARHCAGLIVISEHFKEVYVHDRGVPLNKIRVIPNWIDDAPSLTSDIGDSVRKEHNIPPDAFLAVYGGNIGVAAGVENLIDAFQDLHSQENIYLLLAGAGSRLPDCQKLIQYHDLKRVKIHTPWHSSDTYAVLRAADLCILPTQGEQSLVSVPSKLLFYMMAGRCVLAVAHPKSETARIISTSQAGWVVSSFDSKSLANHIGIISKLPSDELGKRGQAGRNYALKHFSKNVILPKLVEFLEKQL